MFSKNSLNFLVMLFITMVVSTHSLAQNSTLNPLLVPAPLIKAMQDVHALAAKAEVRNLFMYKYSYYQGGFCAEQDCSSAFIQSQINLMKTLMGSDFIELEKKLSYYDDEIRTALLTAPHKDVDNLISNRPALDILSRSVFTTCVDFAKAIAAQAFANGMKSKDLKFFWTMGLEKYMKMCPKRQSQAAILPRPLVHTIIAYKFGKKWYAINSENPNPEIIPLGRKLPNRLSMNFIFSKPALVSGLPLIYAGSYDFAGFINGFQNQTMLNITASGRESSDTGDFVCE